MDLAKPAVSESAICEPKDHRGDGLTVHALKPGLKVKLLLLITTLSLISILISTLIYLNLQRRQLISSAESSAEVLSNTLKANLQHAMLTNDWEMVNSSIQAVVKDGTVDSIRILDKESEISASSRPDEIGKRYRQTEPECQACHTSGTSVLDQATIFTPQGGGQVLFSVSSIQNQPECWACHSPGVKTLGLMILETPLTALKDQLRMGIWQTATIALATVLLLTGMIIPVLNRWVIRPVEELSKGVMEINAGNLDHPVGVVNQDELGELAASFNRMRQQLKSSYEEVEHREQEAMTLYALGTHISASLALHELLHAVAEAARELMGADIGQVGLLDEIRQEVVIGAAAGIRADGMEGMRILVGAGTPEGALLEGRPIMVEVYDPEEPILHDRDSIREACITSFLAAPLRRGDRFMGFIEVLTRQRRRFLEHDAKLLLRLAHQVVVSIENAQLYGQLRLLATLEERDRLAREMHDNLAQALGYLNVKAGMTEDLLCEGRIDQAQESLLELKKVTKFVYTDVREAIFNLRTAASSKMDLLSTLQDYLADYRVHYGLDTRLVIEKEEPGELPPEVISQLLRIVQEALTNVRKHAGASRAWVRYQRVGNQICIRIEDDGRGFYPPQGDEAGRQCFGLQIMRERAGSVGGSLEVDSQPGQGTRVIVRAPVHQYE